ncbi:MAG: glutamate--tRNA ligase [Acidimicrobiia bacterium]
MTVRVRIAPSPTGYVHVGNTRSALFNWLFARHHGGTFILRIDDTDVERSEAIYEDDIKDGLRWLGLDWDEGVDAGGPHGSYRQSDRFDHYREVAHDLVARGLAYHDPRSQDELEVLRQQAVAEKKHPNTYIRRPDVTASSGVIRFSVPQDQAIEFHDQVRDDMRFEAAMVDDFVILRSDGVPTYHLASVTDDVDYRITHVARGEDLLPSTPKHILLTRALGGDIPTYAHLPLLFGPDGKKLSKRHGDTSLKAYREGGYLPAAMLNFLALLGWSIGSDRTVFTLEEAVAAFDLSAVSKNPAVFDLDKLAWINGEYIRSMPADDFAAAVLPGIESDLGRKLATDERDVFADIAPLVQERTKLLTEVADQVRFLFGDVTYHEDSWEKVMAKDGVAEVIAAATVRLAVLDPFGAASIEVALRAMLEELGIGAKKGLQPLRVAVTGSAVSPPLFESMAALGRDTTLLRLETAASRLG